MYIPDISAERAYEKVYPKGGDGFDYIIHTASPVDFHVTDLQSGLIHPAIQGCASSCPSPVRSKAVQLISCLRTTALMQCAHELGGSKLKRFVLLGSAVAALNSFEDMSVAGRDYTEDDWNPVRWLTNFPFCFPSS